MGHSKMKVLGHGTGLTLAVALCVMLTAGCATITMKLRKPGVHHVSFADEVAVEYNCADRKLPFFSIEKNDLLPSHPKRGGELSHRLIYVLCPSVPTESIEGKLTTRILHKARTLKTDAIPFSIEEGRWVMHTFISLPESAEPGAYALEVSFRSKKGNLIATAPFVIE